MDSNGNRLLTAREVAERIGVTVQSISIWCQEGAFPHAYKAGRGPTSPWKIPEKDLDAFMKQQLKRAPAVKA